MARGKAKSTAASTAPTAGKTDAVPKPSVEQASGNPAAGAAVSKAETELQQAGEVRKRHRRTKAEINAEKDKVNSEAMIRMQAELDILFAPENFDSMVTAPADIMFAMTGSDVWDLSESDKLKMSKPASICAKHFLQTEPKWIALAILAMNVGTIYGTRTALYLKERKKTKPNTDERKDDKKSGV